MLQTMMASRLGIHRALADELQCSREVLSKRNQDHAVSRLSAACRFTLISDFRESRHPNVVQYLGLCLAPAAPEGPQLPPLSFNGSAVSNPPSYKQSRRQRILIISEYLTGGNLRSFIASPSMPFPWRLRLSFAVDVSRAVAYMHARRCMHRDLKGENLLITENQRIKVCDFGFARIAARNEEEMRRMSYCGTVSNSSQCLVEVLTISTGRLYVSRDIDGTGLWHRNRCFLAR